MRAIFIVFNNRYSELINSDQVQSAIVEIDPPLNSGGNYDINENSTFGPNYYDWLYNSSAFFSATRILPESNKSKVLLIAFSNFLLDLEFTWFLFSQASLIIFSKELIFIMLL